MHEKHAALDPEHEKARATEKGYHRTATPSKGYSTERALRHLRRTAPRRTAPKTTMAEAVTAALERHRGAVSAGGFGKAVKLLGRYMQAVADAPAEAKFRRIAANNPSLVKRLGKCPELLLACGWAREGEVYAYGADRDGSAARCTLLALQRAAAAPRVAPLAESSSAQVNVAPPPAVAVAAAVAAAARTPVRVKPEPVTRVKQEPSHEDEEVAAPVPKLSAAEEAEKAFAADLAAEWEQATRPAARSSPGPEFQFAAPFTPVDESNDAASHGADEEMDWMDDQAEFEPEEVSWSPDESGAPDVSARAVPTPT